MIFISNSEVFVQSTSLPESSTLKLFSYKIWLSSLTRFSTFKLCFTRSGLVHITRLQVNSHGVRQHWKWTRSYMKRDINKNLPGNEVYYTNALILLIKIMMCSKLHCQKGFRLKPFFYKIEDNGHSVCRRDVLADSSQVVMLGLQYTSVNFGYKANPGPANYCAQIDRERGGGQ